ncbi:hypothetical protein [Pseudomonas sp. NPDC086251]|uniref:hypothetical protein n=1 Tax=Pseudomonas sp. NPDC086251 TaxID=3364431 RepID=UPI003838F0D4
MSIKEWAGVPLVIIDSDRYFFDEDSLRDYLIDSDVDLTDEQLCICEPNYERQLDPTDVFGDDLPEDGKIRDDQLEATFELLNEWSSRLSLSRGRREGSPPCCHSRTLTGSLLHGWGHETDR